MDRSACARSSEPEPTGLVHAPNSPIVGVIRGCVRIAQSDATVLITGETGTGKEVFARLVHERSRRAHHPMVPVNCAAIPEALLESELFGHVRGAFTGAVTSRRGRIAAAQGGTLFLDEIGDLPLPLQVKLLRVLQERAYEPVGSTESVPADFRLVAATNRDLAAEVEAGTFRRDLYYRLLVCPVELPPLRERRQDVSPLFEHFWSRRGDRRPVEPDLLRLLENHPWPGNVRELENLVERLAVCSDGNSIGVGDLPRHLRVERPPVPLSVVPHFAADAAARAVTTSNDWDHPREEAAPRSSPGGFPSGPVPTPPPLPHFDGQTIDLPTLLRRMEESFIDAALTHTAGNKKAAADLLGLQRTTLVEKLRRRTRDAPVC